MTTEQSFFSKILVKHTIDEFCLKNGWLIVKNNLLDLDYRDFYQNRITLGLSANNLFELEEFFYKNNIFLAQEQFGRFQISVHGGLYMKDLDSKLCKYELVQSYEVTLTAIKQVGKKKPLNYSRKFSQRKDLIIFLNFSFLKFHLFDCGKDFTSQERYDQSIIELLEEFLTIKELKMSGDY